MSDQDDGSEHGSPKHGVGAASSPPAPNQPAPIQPAPIQSAPCQVVRLTGHPPIEADRVVRELRQYWSGLRNGRAIPARADVEPRGIARALDYAFILERIAPGAARIRLAGRHLIDLMGMEVRGMPICSFMVGPSRGRLSDVLETVFKAPQIAHLHLHAKAAYARPEMRGQMLLLPLRSDLGDVTRALGCLIAEGETGVAPRRFELLSDSVIPIIEGGKTLAPSPSTIGFSEGAEGYMRQPVKTPEKPAAPPPITPEERRALFRLITPGPGQD